MKAIILIIIVTFSFTTLQAQKATSATTSTSEVQKEETKELMTKADFYNALIKVNKFDIKIKDTKIVNTAYYNKLLIKNGFRLRTRKSCRLVYNDINTTKGISLLHITTA